jgi:hypothetical protein
VPLAAAARNPMLSQLATLATHMSLHSAYSASGANELAGGSPAYARQALSWGSPAGGGMALSGSETFDVPAGASVAFVGFWGASSGGTFYGMAPAGSGAPLVFTAAAAGDLLTVPGHAFTDTQTVVAFPAPGATLPTGLVAGTVYFVRDTSGSTLKLAATSGGAAIDITGNGSGLIQAVTVEPYAGQGLYTVSDPSVGDMLALI